MLGLPEIEILRRDLDKEIVGRRFKEVEVRPGSNAMKIIPRHGRRKELSDLLEGAKVERIDRVGRKLIFDLDNGRVIIVALGLNAKLAKTSASEEIAPHTHLVMTFTIGGQLRVTDPKLQTEVFVTPVDDLDGLKKELRDFAIDPLEQQFTWHHFSAMLEERDAPLRTVLSDESFLCRLGPIYIDELLWAAGLRHDRPSNKLSSQDVRRLYRSLMEIVQDAVKARGTSLGDNGFRDLLGEPGAFQIELKVYDREGEACRRCRSAIVKEPIGDGVTYLCAQCQS